LEERRRACEAQPSEDIAAGAGEREQRGRGHDPSVSTAPQRAAHQDEHDVPLPSEPDTDLNSPIDWWPFSGS